MRPCLSWTVIGLIAAAPAPALAGQYALIRASTDAWTLIDPRAIERDANGLRRTWTVTVQRNILGGGAVQPGYVRTLREFDCAFQLTRWRRFSAYSRTGGLLISEENPTLTWTNVENSAETSHTHAYICRNVMATVISADNISSAVIALLGSWDPPPAPAPPPKPAAGVAR